MVGYKWQKEEEKDVRHYWMALRKGRVLEIERGNSGLHCVENSFWKRVCRIRKIDYRMNEFDFDPLQVETCS